MLYGGYSPFGLSGLGLSRQSFGYAPNFAQPIGQSPQLSPLVPQGRELPQAQSANPINPSGGTPGFESIAGAGLTPLGGAGQGSSGGSIWDNFMGPRTIGAGAGDSYFQGGAQGILPLLQGYGSGALGGLQPTTWGSYNPGPPPPGLPSSVGYLQSPFGGAFSPSPTPYGLNPFAAQADSWGMLSNNPFAGRMNPLAMGLGHTPSYRGPWQLTSSLPWQTPGFGTYGIDPVTGRPSANPRGGTWVDDPTINPATNHGFNSDVVGGDDRDPLTGAPTQKAK